MAEVDENLQPTPQQVVAPLAFDIDYEADAAGIVLVGRVVETLCAARSGIVREGDIRCICLSDIP